MSRPIITIHNTETDEIIEREMNDAEFAQYEIDMANAIELKAKLEAEVIAKATAKQAAQNKLKALGLNDLEIAAITGA